MFHRFCAFTLAEVLITLAITGIIAFVTIPVLLRNNQSSPANKTVTRQIVAARASSSCAFEICGTCYGTPFYPTELTYDECSEVKAALGLKYCYDSTTTTTTTDTTTASDYYAGAALACGGVSNLPTHAQLTELAEYLYNTCSISSSETTKNLTLDTDKASALGFDVSCGSFSVWSGQEGSSHVAYARGFYSTGTYWGDNYRSNSNLQAVCSGD